MTKRILILGGGAAGVTSALTLAEAKQNHLLDIDIVLVNRDEWHYMPPLWMDVAVEGLPVEDTRAPIRGLEKYGVNVVIGEATDIDLANRRIVLADSSVLEYDYLILALGSRNGWEVVSGLDKAGYHNYDPQNAVTLNRALADFQKGNITILVPEVPFRCLIYPLEIATVLGHRYHAKGRDVSIQVIAPRLPNGMTITERFGPEIQEIWARYLSKYNIEIITHNGIEKIDPDNRKIVARNAEYNYDLLIKTPPPRLPTVLERPELVNPKDPRWTVATPREFRHPKYTEVFLVGEHALPSVGLGLSGGLARNAAYKAATVIMNEVGFAGEIYELTSVTWVAHVGNRGFVSACEITFDGSRYTVSHCYSIMESSLARMFKRAFYKGWLDRLRG